MPVDPTGPAVRAAAILAASEVKAALVSAGLAQSLRAAWPATRPFPRLILVEDSPRVADAGARLSRGERNTTVFYFSGRARYSEVAFDSADPAAFADGRWRRPGVHPVHFGIDWSAQGRDAFAYKCIHISRLVRD